MTFRWYGEAHDAITLAQIRQIPGMTGIMGVLDEKAAGEVWTEEEIATYMETVHKAGLQCEIIESVNVHEDIKMGLPTRDSYIENYCITLQNLAKFGVKVVIYNFMPVFDWLRTDLARRIPEDGSNSLYFDESALGNLSPVELVRSTLDGCNGFTLPGWEPERLADLERVLAIYQNIDETALLANYRYFLEGVMPTCEAYGIKIAVHPDDPAWPVFGLPRVVHNASNLETVLRLCDSPYHTLCLCTGSLGSDPDNDIPAMIRRFGSNGKISCLHVRNVKHLGHHCFREAAHLSDAGDLDLFDIMKAVYDTCPEVYIRPDHGRMIWGETGRPGYGLYDRALGATYLNGLWEAIVKMSGRNENHET